MRRDRHRAATTVLRVAIALQCGGAAWSWWRDGAVWGDATPLLSIAVIVLGIAVLIRATPMALVALTALFGLEAVLETAAGHGVLGRLAVVAHAIRFGAPLALYVMTRSPDRGLAIVRYAVAAVFLGHGLEAAFRHAPFPDYLRVTILKMFAVEITPGQVAGLLVIIGVVDLLCALLVVVRPSRTVLGYMAFWGGITAVMRLVYFGPLVGAPFFIVRALNGAAPLALLLATGLQRSRLRSSTFPATVGPRSPKTESCGM